MIVSSSNAQTISARVLDPNGNPLKDAKVFYNNSTISTRTNASGVFSISANFQSDLVIYYPTYEIYIEPEVDKFLPVYQLDYKEDDLKIIDTRNTKFKKDKLLYFLRRCFLGSGKYARKIEILNEEDISIGFNMQTNSIEAKSSKPLLIKNDALGYLIEHYLEYFEVEFTSVELEIENVVNIYTSGSSYFRDIDSSKVKERDDLHKASLAYFFKQVSIQDYDKLSYKILIDDEKVKPKQLFEKVEQDNGNYRIFFHKNLGAYNDVDEFTLTLKLISKEKSIDIEFYESSILVDTHGNVKDKGSMFVLHEFTNKRLAYKVPLDYKLSK
jgi:hypothetical protein